MTLLLIDLGSVYWNAYHSSANEPISAAHDRAVRHVRFLREKFAHEHCAVACDSLRSLRKEKHPTYKANRDPKEKAAVEQLRRVKETLEADGLLLWQCDGLEADDILATAVREARKRDLPVLVASADKDLLALVDDTTNVRVVSTKTDVIHNENAVFEKLGVWPRQVRDWLALVGDSSDNIQGVPKVGAKTAADLLKRYDNLEMLMAALARDPSSVSTPAVVKSLQESREILKVGIDLVTLRTDAPINFEDIFKEREVKQLAQVDDAEFTDEANEDWPIPEVGKSEQQTEAPPDSERRDKQSPQPADETPLPRVEVVSSKPTQAITVADPNQAPAKWEHALEPRSFQAGWALAKCLFNSRLFNVASPEAAMAIIMAGRSMGLDAVTSLRGFHVVKGRPVMSAALMTGVILGSGKAKYFRLLKSTNDEAVYETWRKGDPEPVQMGFSITDAKRAQLSFAGDSNWSKYPRTMLRWRAAAELARAVYPDVVMNVYVPGELEEEEAEVA